MLRQFDVALLPLLPHQLTINDGILPGKDHPVVKYPDSLFHSDVPLLTSPALRSRLCRLLFDLLGLVGPILLKRCTPQRIERSG